VVGRGFPLLLPLPSAILILFMTTLLPIPDMLDRLDLSSSSSSSSTQSSFGFNNSRSSSELDSPTDTPPLSPSSSLSSLEIKNTSNVQKEQTLGLYTQILHGMAAQHWRVGQRSMFEDELKESTIASSNQGLVTPKISRLPQVCADDAGYQSDYERSENGFLLSKRKRLARRKAALKHCNDVRLICVRFVYNAQHL